jgi:tetratricopeptide (TPR) repeat protein
LNHRRAALALPALVAIASHLRSLSCGFVFDDRGVIVDNPLMQELSQLPRLVASPWWAGAVRDAGLWRPLTSLTFALDRALAGLDATWFHAVNLGWHALATWLVTLLAFELGAGLAGALVAGGLFAVHPAHTEAVVGIVGRAELIAAAAVVAALLLQRRALRPGAGTGPAILAPVAAFAAMLAKESGFAVVVLLPFIGPAATASDGAAATRRRRGLWIGHGAALVLALLLRLAVLGRLGPGAGIPFVDNPAASAGWITGHLTALACVTRYARLLLWPRALSADYSYAQIPLASGFGDARALAGLALVAAVLALGWRFRRKRPLVGFGFLLLAASLAPASNLIVFAGTLLAERVLYLPVAGLVLAAAGLLVAIPPGAPRAAAFLLATLLGGLGLVRTATRIPDWRDDFSLYRSAAAASPRSTRIHYNLGNAWLRQERFAEAETEYRQAVAIYPDFADARANLGMALLQQGRAAEALDVLEAAADRLPHNAELAVNLGSALRAVGRPAEAEAQFERALAIDGTTATAWNNLGSIRLQRGDAPGAVAALEKAVAAAPSMAIYQVNLGDALLAAGRRDDSLRAFDAAGRLDQRTPEVRRAVGEAALQRGDVAAAQRAFEAAAGGDPPSARADNFLGFLATRGGDADAAIGWYDRAVGIDPGLADAHRNLAVLLAPRPGEARRAAEHLRRSLEIDPHQADSEGAIRMLRDLESRVRQGRP